MADTKPTGAAGASQGAGPGDLDEGSNGGGVPEAPTGNLQQKPSKADLEETHDGDTKTPEQKALEDTVKAGEAAKKTEEAPTEEPEKGSEEWHKQFIQTGNEHADAAIDVMKEAGVSPIEANAVFQKAIESGDLKDVNWNILEDKIGKSKTALVKAGVETFYQTEYKERLAVVTEAHKIVGGEENWKTVRAWAQKAEKADPAVKAQIDNIRKGIDAGGAMAEFAINTLKTMYESAPGNKGLGVKNIVQGEKAAPPAATDRLTRSEYMKERHKLAEAGVPENDPKVYALFKRYQG